MAGTVQGTRGINLSDEQRYALALNAGFSHPDAIIMTAISLAESGGPSNSLNDNRATGDYSIGPWQINLRDNNGNIQPTIFGYNAQDLANPFNNAAAARQKFNSQGFNAWSVWGTAPGHSNSYLVFIPRALNAAANVDINPANLADRLGEITQAVGAGSPSGGGQSTGNGSGLVLNTTPGLLVVFVAIILLILGAIIWGKMFSIQGPKTVVQVGSQRTVGIGGGISKSSVPTPKPIQGFTRTRMTGPHTYHTRTVIVKHK